MRPVHTCKNEEKKASIRLFKNNQPVEGTAVYLGISGPVKPQSIGGNIFAIHVFEDLSYVSDVFTVNCKALLFE